MSEAMMEKYQKHRQAGVRSADAWRWAKGTVEPIAWGVEFAHQGWDVTCRYEEDEGASGDCLGYFSDDETDGCLDLGPVGVREMGTYRYFHPEVSETEHYDALRALCKMGKTEARDKARGYVKLDYGMAKAYVAYVVIVDVRLKGVKLGSDSIGGCSIGDDDPSDSEYLMDMAWDIVAEAIGEAEEKLAELRK